MEEKILKCPGCGYDVFRRRSEDKVQMIDNGDEIRDEPINEIDWAEPEYLCAKCGMDVTNEELN